MSCPKSFPGVTIALDTFGSNDLPSIQTNTAVKGLLAKITQAQQIAPTKVSAQQIRNQVLQHKLWLKDPTQGQRADFSHQDLSGVNFSNMDLRGAIFTKANLSGTNFQNTQLELCDFSKANCYQTDFTHAKMNRSIFTGAWLENSDLSLANISDANFTLAQIRTSLFSNTIAQNTNFHHSTIMGSSLRNSKMQDVDISESIIQGNTFTGDTILQAKNVYHVLVGPNQSVSATINQQIDKIYQQRDQQTMLKLKSDLPSSHPNSKNTLLSRVAQKGQPLF